MSKPDFVYVIYIATTPERLWEALTSSELTRQYWGGTQLSDWQAGSRWEHVRNTGDGKSVVIGDVIESDPPHKLVLSWGHATDDLRHEGLSQVTFNIEKIQDAVQLTVIHDHLEPEMFKNISSGWPRVLSNLKTFIETGRSFDAWVC